MATQAQDSPRNQDVASNNIGSDNQEAQLFDDLTVLSREPEEKLVQKIEDNITAPDRVDGTGNENVQTGSRIYEEKHEDKIVEGTIIGEKITVARYQTNVEIAIPTLETRSAGHQDPVPSISQPLPAAEIAFDPATQGKVQEPTAPPPDVVTPIGGGQTESGARIGARQSTTEPTPEPTPEPTTTTETSPETAPATETTATSTASN